MTTMIATCSVENKNIHVSDSVKETTSSVAYFVRMQETISTCRFSQRVALVKNEATLNKELDPKLVT